MDKPRLFVGSRWGEFEKLRNSAFEISTKSKHLKKNKHPPSFLKTDGYQYDT